MPVHPKQRTMKFTAFPSLKELLAIQKCRSLIQNPTLILCLSWSTHYKALDTIHTNIKSMYFSINAFFYPNRPLLSEQANIQRWLLCSADKESKPFESMGSLPLLR